MSATETPHVLVIPYPAQGHMLPLLDLTHQLSLRGLSITILVTPKNLPILSPLLSSHPSTITPLVLPFPPHPDIPHGVEHVKDLGNAGNLLIMKALRSLHDPLIQWFTSQTKPPVAIISDFFVGWTSNLAAQLNIPRITFFSSNAFWACVTEYLWNNVERVESLPEVKFGFLPKAPVFKEEHLPSLFRRAKRDEANWESFKKEILGNFTSWGCVFNTFEAMECEYLEYFMGKIRNDRVFGVGPLSLLGMDSTGRNDPSGDSGSDEQLLTWLDGCPDGSVVYVCFGSQKLLNTKQMEGLAAGLETSGTRFVWVVKLGKPGLAETVPDGFEERVATRGVIVKGWAPQTLILGHRAVGGFLSHCGWNSVLEAVVNGVMILAWPMEADQFLNAKLLVDYMEVGVGACEGADSVPDSVILGSVIAQSMAEEGQVKVRAKQLRDKALAAVMNGGSSGTDLDKLVRELRQLSTT